jgi:putative NADH-flavin reductase
MKVALFGSTGKSGVLVAKKALAEGHTVTAYARNPSKMMIQHARLTVIQGELSEAARIAELLRGQEAVISLLGPTGKNFGDQLTQGMQAIIAGMKAHNVRRSLLLSRRTLSFPASCRFIPAHCIGDNALIENRLGVNRPQSRRFYVHLN